MKTMQESSTENTKNGKLEAADFIRFKNELIGISNDFNDLVINVFNYLDQKIAGENFQQKINHANVPALRNSLQNFAIDSDLMTSEQVMIMLKISKRTLQTYRNESKIPFCKFYNRIYYKRSEILAVFNNCQFKSSGKCS
jgi:hypothetical protein